jgi:hypothetical protein
MSEAGPNSAVSRFLRHGCFTLETGHWLARPKRANCDQTQRSKIHAYSITSSARNRMEVGIVTPKAFAVLRFTTSWN